MLSCTPGVISTACVMPSWYVAGCWSSFDACWCFVDIRNGTMHWACAIISCERLLASITNNKCDLAFINYMGPFHFVCNSSPLFLLHVIMTKYPTSILILKTFAFAFFFYCPRLQTCSFPFDTSLWIAFRDSYRLPVLSNSHIFPSISDEEVCNIFLQRAKRLFAWHLIMLLIGRSSKHFQTAYQFSSAILTKLLWRCKVDKSSNGLNNWDLL